MLSELKKMVYEANMLLPQYELVTFTWGNVSGIDRARGLVVIKPSGVAYDELSYKDMVVVDLNGNVIEGEYAPSSDTPTHIEIYKHFDGVGGVTHTHSQWATAWAQAGMDIKALGTTHADYMYGDVPCTRALTQKEIQCEYEKQTGKVIVECCPHADVIPSVLVRNHGPFTWGSDAKKSVENAVVLEQVAKMAFISTMLSGGTLDSMPQMLLDKHYLRKHGKDAYYGQK
ncbi:MAG: L-ribulose-5-phosphate 4-epimerase [Christensenellaceae bacterium]